MNNLCLSRPYEPYLKTVILRLLAARPAPLKFVRPSAFKASGVDELLGLDRGGNTDAAPLTRIRAMARVGAAGTPGPPGILLPRRFQRNLATLGRVFDLDADALQILGFFLIGCADERLAAVLRATVPIDGRAIHAAVARALGMRAPLVRRLLACGQPLSDQGGIMAADRESDDGWAGRPLFSGELAARTFHGTLEASGKFPELGSPAPAPPFTIRDWPGQENAISLVVAHLATARRTSAKGVNILLNGFSRGGKSELAAAIARDAGFAGVRVFSGCQADGSSVPADGLLCHLAAFQRARWPGSTMLLADGRHRMLPGPDDGRRSLRPALEAQFKLLLATNVVPTIWICRNEEGVHPALIHHFDMVLDVEPLSTEQREKHLTGLLGDTIGPQVLRWTAGLDKASPELAARTVDVVRRSWGDQPVAVREQVFQTLISGALKAQGHDTAADPARHALANDPDPRWLNTDHDLAGLPAALRANPSARICLYGPPGTGKTSFAHWLAHQLGHPILVRRASDLLNCYHGKTEENIMCAFRTARSRNAILMLDEVDSFLQDRTKAQRVWESSQVNELLVQMENFRGIFLAATNLMDNIDQAALRRFDLKIALGHLRPDQSESLLERTCARLGLAEPSATDRRGVRALTNATPGDFANVSRQHALRPFVSSAAFVAALARECQGKPGHRHASIGFSCPP